MSQILYFLAILVVNIVMQFHTGQVHGHPADVEYHQNLNTYHIARERDKTTPLICRFDRNHKDFTPRYDHRDVIYHVMKRGYSFIIRKRKGRISDTFLRTNILRVSSCCFMQDDNGQILNTFIDKPLYFRVQYFILQHLDRTAIESCDQYSVIFASSPSKLLSKHNTQIPPVRRKRDLGNESSIQPPALKGKSTKGNLSVSPTSGNKSVIGKPDASKAVRKTTVSSSKSFNTLSVVHLNSTDISEVRRELELQMSKDPYWAFLCVVSIVVLTLYLVYWTKICQNSRSDLQYVDYLDHIYLTNVHDTVVRKAKFLDIFRKWKRNKMIKQEKSSSANKDDSTHLLDTTDTEDVYNA